MESDAKCNFYSYNGIVFEGKSTKRTPYNTTIHQNKDATNEAKEKAPHQAETIFFRYIFGIYGPKEFTVDELGRPVEES